MLTNRQKDEILVRLATAFTLCDAHNDELNKYHDLAVYMATALWMLSSQFSQVSECTLSSIESELKKL